MDKPGQTNSTSNCKKKKKTAAVNTESWNQQNHVKRFSPYPYEKLGKLCPTADSENNHLTVDWKVIGNWTCFLAVKKKVLKVFKKQTKKTHDTPNNCCRDLPEDLQYYSNTDVSGNEGKNGL